MLKKILLIHIFLPLWLNAGLNLGIGELPTSSKHKRPEDFYFISSQKSKEIAEGLMIGLFDGHGDNREGKHDGFRVAKHAKENMEQVIRKKITEQPDVERALKIAFKEVEQSVPEKELCGFCGTTALVGLIKNNTLFLANSGDSQALVVLKSGKSIFTVPHKAIPGTSEGERIKQHKGIIHSMYAFDLAGEGYVLSEITDYRTEPPTVEWFDRGSGGPVDQHIIDTVLHSSDKLENLSREWFVGFEGHHFLRLLGMSRDLGDFEFKKIGLISEPDIYIFPVNEIDYVIYASDGLWNGVDTDFITRFVAEQKRAQTSTQIICETLAKIARSNGSTDDITIIGTFF